MHRCHHGTPFAQHQAKSRQRVRNKPKKGYKVGIKER